MEDTLSDPSVATKQRTQTIITTLYDLIDAVNTTVGPENEELVVAIVAQMLHSGRVRFLRDDAGMMLGN
jgi:hypothetical protein